MDLQADFNAQLDKEGVEFTDRDATLLEAIYKHASLNKAADALGRSYSRSQQRVVELESAFGPLVDRQRGGTGGGGSTLTTTAQQLLQEFDRLQVEFTGVAEAEETILPGTIVECDGELATIETAAGSIRAVIPASVPNVRVSIRADAVTLHAPRAVPDSETSARNRFRGTVVSIEEGDALARVFLDIGADTDLTALVTHTSITTLDLGAGDEVMASFKATATRAVPSKQYSLDVTD